MNSGTLRLSDINRCPERRLDYEHYDLATGICGHRIEGGHVPAPILKYFEYKHLSPPLAEVSQQFHDLAHWVDENLPASAETTTALRKLLEGKDAAVRAKLDTFG